MIQGATRSQLCLRGPRKKADNMLSSEDLHLKIVHFSGSIRHEMS